MKAYELIFLLNSLDCRMEGNMHQARSSKEMQYEGKKMVGKALCTKPLYLLK